MANILVVDDSQVERRLAMALLQRGLDCTLAEADCAESAIEHLQTITPEIVLTDLQMPGMSGLDLVEYLRNERPSMPVILMTAVGSEDIAAEALKSGAASYVPKSRLAKDLIPTVRRILAGSQQERTHSRLMHHLNRGELDFDLRNDVTLVTPLVRIVQEMLRSLPLEDEAERLRVGVALEEALKNAVYHGNMEVGSQLEETRSHEELFLERQWMPPYCNRRVNVNIVITHEAALFKITDEGPGFDASVYETDEFNADDPRGRGIRLMRTFMDSVEFLDDGRQVLLKKFRYEGDVDDLADSDD